MSTQGWIFMVGLRVFDLGALVAWLVWFYRLRDDDDGRGQRFIRDDNWLVQCSNPARQNAANR